MPKSVKDMLVEREHYDELKDLHSIYGDIGSAQEKVKCFREHNESTDKAFLESLDCLDKSMLSVTKMVDRSISLGRSAISGLTEAKTFEEDFPFAHFSHGLMTCYVDPATNRFVLTKDSRNGLHNYDTIVLMTKNDLKNIIKVCTEMLEDEKAKKVPDEEEEVVNG